MLKDWLLGKEDAGNVNHLLDTHRGSCVVGQAAEVFHAIENHVDRLGNVVMHVTQFHFFGFDLLRLDVAMGGAQVQHESMDAGGALASGTLEQCSEVDLVDGFDELGNQRFLCGLTDFESLFEF